MLITYMVYFFHVVFSPLLNDKMKKQRLLNASYFPIFNHFNIPEGLYSEKFSKIRFVLVF